MSTLIPEFTLPKDFCADAREAYTIPARFYTHQAAFEHEKEQVFATSWICVAHRSELAQPNDYITREIIGENILVVRGRDNVLRAFTTSARTAATSCWRATAGRKTSSPALITHGRSSWTANWRTRATAKTCRTSIRKTRT